MLSITTEYSKMTFHHERASQSIRVPKAQMSIQSQPTQMYVNHQPVRLQIDSTEMWASLGIYGPVRATKEVAARAQQIAFESIGETGDQWRAMMQPGAGRAQMAQMAWQRTRPQTGETQVAFLPRVKPDISWIPPQLDVSWSPHSVDIAWQTNPMAQIEYHPYSFTTSATPYSVRVAYLGEPQTGGDVLRALHQYA